MKVPLRWRWYLTPDGARYRRIIRAVVRHLQALHIMPQEGTQLLELDDKKRPHAISCLVTFEKGKGANPRVFVSDDQSNMSPPFAVVRLVGDHRTVDWL